MKQPYAFLAAALLSITAPAQFTPGSSPAVAGNSFAVHADGDLILTGQHAPFNSRLFRSTDGGATFHALYPSSGPVDVRVILKLNGTYVIAVNEAEKVYRSTDNGDTWTISNTGMPTLYSPKNGVVVGQRMIVGGTTFLRYSDDEGQSWHSFDIDGGTMGLNYAGGHVWANVGGTSYRSSDAGDTWEALPTNPSSAVTGYAAAAGAIVATTDYSGGVAIRRSTDDGQSWTTVSGAPNIVRFAYQIDDVIYITTYEGLRRSTDAGLTWQAVGGFNHDVVSGYHGQMHLDGNDLWVCTANGPVRLDLADDSQTTHTVPHVSMGQVVAHNGALYATLTDAVLKSTDQGASWTSLATGHDNFTVHYLAPVGGALYLAIRVGSDRFLLRSTDNGGSFQPVDLGNVDGDITTIGEANGVLYVSWFANWAAHIVRSTDGGATWTAATVAQAPGMYNSNDGQVRAIRAIGSLLVAEVEAGYMLSTDNGLNWAWYNNTLERTSVQGWSGRMVQSFADNHWWEPAPANRVLVRESSDNGATWQLVEDGLPTVSAMGFGRLFRSGDRVVLQIIDPDVPEAFRFYALEQGATTWAHAPELDGLPTPATDFLATNGAHYAAVPGSGLWSTGTGTGIHGPAAGIPTVAVHPNPASDRVRLPAEWANAQVQVIDAAGRAVATLRTSMANNAIDVAALPTGIYHLRIVAGERIAVARLAVQR